MLHAERAVGAGHARDQDGREQRGTADTPVDAEVVIARRGDTAQVVVSQRPQRGVRGRREGGVDGEEREEEVADQLGQESGQHRDRGHAPLRSASGQFQAASNGSCPS